VKFYHLLLALLLLLCVAKLTELSSVSDALLMAYLVVGALISLRYGHRLGCYLSDRFWAHLGSKGRNERNDQRVH